jgi:hypothetical protein
MRLFEAVSDVSDSLGLFLRNKIGVADEIGQPLSIPFSDPELQSFLHSQGIGELTYDALDSMLKKPENQELKDLITNYDEQEMTLKTKVGSDKQQTNLTPNSTAGKSVDQMAHNVVAGGV